MEDAEDEVRPRLVGWPACPLLVLPDLNTWAPPAPEAGLIVVPLEDDPGRGDEKDVEDPDPEPAGDGKGDLAAEVDAEVCVGLANVGVCK